MEIRFAHSKQLHASTETLNFALILSQHPPNPVLLAPETAALIGRVRTTSSSLRFGLLKKLRHMFVATEKRTGLSQRAYKEYFTFSVRLVYRSDLREAFFVCQPPTHEQTRIEAVIFDSKSELTTTENYVTY